MNTIGPIGPSGRSGSIKKTKENLLKLLANRFAGLDHYFPDGTLNRDGSDGKSAAGSTGPISSGRSWSPSGHRAHMGQMGSKRPVTPRTFRAFQEPFGPGPGPMGPICICVPARDPRVPLGLYRALHGDLHRAVFRALFWL